MTNRIYIVGAGGVGSWLTPALCMLRNDPKFVTVIDGDFLEDKNLNRQLFSTADIGKYKAEALASKYGCESLPRFFHRGTLQLRSTDLLFCCVDNHRGRKECLAASDLAKCLVFIGANEETSAEAFVYKNEWLDTPLDPRVYYPEIESDNSNDPISRGIGCVAEAQETGRTQIVSANFQAAALMQQLAVLWWLKYPSLDPEVLPKLPYRLRATMTGLFADKIESAEEAILRATTDCRLEVQHG